MAANESQQKLGQMLKAAPDQSAAIEKSIVSVQDQIDELTDEANAIEGSMTDVAEIDAVAYITTNILPLYPGGYIVYGPAFGTIAYGPSPPKGNISDWAIWKDITPVPPPILPPVPTLQYPYTPGDYPDLDKLVADYVFGNDYLTRPLDTGATYGIYPSRTAMIAAKALLQENKDTVDESITKFPDYV
jgi:hypothetical protein